MTKTVDGKTNSPETLFKKKAVCCLSGSVLLFSCPIAEEVTSCPRDKCSSVQQCVRATVGKKSYILRLKLNAKCYHNNFEKKINMRKKIKHFEKDFNISRKKK